jgi:hypothetical protein
MEAGGFISTATAAKEAVRELDREFEKAQKSGDKQRAGELYFAKQRTEATAAGFQRDVNNYTNNPRYAQIMRKQDMGQALTKGEEKYIMRLEELNGSLKKVAEALNESIGTGSSADIRKQMYGFEDQAKEFHKMVSGSEKDTDKGAAGAVKAIGVGQIANAISQGFAQYVTSMDRTGVIGAYGSGDLMGGQLADMRRKAGFWAGISRIGGTLAGTGIGALAGNPIMGGMLGSAGGDIIASAIEGGTIGEANRVAYAQLWSGQTNDMMNLAALIGDPADVKNAFEIAANAAEKFGYSAEDGAAAIKAAAQQGIDVDEATRLSQQIFEHERATGADRGTMTSLAMMSERYGGGNALDIGFAGLQASGMKQGQYTEYLRAMQRVMEDGISKGFIRSSDQVAHNLTMLSQLTGNSPFWQGENGARRLSEMNAGLESATGLKSSSDILAMRAARNVTPDGEDYIDTILTMEKGLTPEFFNEYMKMIGNVEGGNRAATIERMRQTFGLNYTNATALYKGYKDEGDLSHERIDELMRTQPGLPNYESNELAAAQITAQTVNEMSRIGQEYWNQKFPELTNILDGIRQDLAAATGVLTPNFRIPINEDLGLSYIRANSPAVVSDYFGSGEGAEQKKLISILGSGAREGGIQRSSASEALQMLEFLPPAVRQRFDSENKLNSIVNNSNDAVQFLALLRELIETEKENGRKLDELNDLDITYNDR